MKINVGKAELFMDKFIVDELGGERIDDNLSKRVNFKNADYRIDYLNQIIELKCLEKDQFDDDLIYKKLSTLTRSRFKNLRNEKKDTNELASEVLSNFSCDIKSLAYPRVKKIIAKANTQIKETKIELDYKNYNGVVWIINENNLFLTTKNLIKIISEILSTESFSSIDAVVLSNLNMQIAKTKNDVPCLYWVPIFREGVSQNVWNATYFLGEIWQTYLRSTFEINPETKSISDSQSGADFKDFNNVKSK